MISAPDSEKNVFGDGRRTADDGRFQSRSFKWGGVFNLLGFMFVSPLPPHLLKPEIELTKVHSVKAELSCLVL